MVEENIKELDFVSDKYKVESFIGRGTFSSCYLATEVGTKNKVAIKAITRTTSPNRIIDELKILQILKGQNFCIPLLDVARNADQVIAVFPHVNYISFRDFIKDASMFDIKKYMYSLLSAINHVHTHGIIHRDIKPGNFLYDKDLGVGFLIDFGLAQYKSSIPKKTDTSKRDAPPVLFFNSIVKPSKPPGYYEKDVRPVMRANRAGTRGFRAPEIIFKYPYQTEKIDCWSAGIIFLCILSAQYPFFLSFDDMDSLVEMGTIFGHSKMRKMAKKFGRVWRTNIHSISEEGIDLETLIDKINPSNLLDDLSIDLLKKLITLDPEERISAFEALKHDFFNK